MLYFCEVLHDLVHSYVRSVGAHVRLFTHEAEVGQDERGTVFSCIIDLCVKGRCQKTAYNGSINTMRVF